MYCGRFIIFSKDFRVSHEFNSHVYNQDNPYDMNHTVWLIPDGRTWQLTVMHMRLRLIIWITDFHPSPYQNLYLLGSFFFLQSVSNSLKSVIIPVSNSRKITRVVPCLLYPRAIIIFRSCKIRENNEIAWKSLNNPNHRRSLTKSIFRLTIQRGIIL